MFNKKYKKAKAEMDSTENFIEDSDGKALITVKAQKEQIFSSYEYDSSEKLNDNLASYLEDKIKLIPANKDLKIKIYSDNSVSVDEVKLAIKANYKREYIVNRTENYKNWFFVATMFLAGALFLGLLLISIQFFNNQFVDTILEIIAWVFLWEMADAMFLKRSHIKLEMARCLRLYCAEIEVVNLDDFDKIDRKVVKITKKSAKN